MPDSRPGENWERDAPVLRSALAAITGSDRDDYAPWLAVGQALHHASNGSSEGLAIWEQWSRASDNFEEDVCTQKWASFHGDRKNGVLTAGAIFHMAEENGWQRPPPLEGMEEAERALDSELIESVEKLPQRKGPVKIAARIPEVLLDPLGLVGEVADYALS